MWNFKEKKSSYFVCACNSVCNCLTPFIILMWEADKTQVSALSPEWKADFAVSADLVLILPLVFDQESLSANNWSPLSVWSSWRDKNDLGI